MRTLPFGPRLQAVYDQLDAQRRPPARGVALPSGPPPAQPSMTVAVVIVCHNYGRFLGEALDSVLGQTVRPTEVLILDDASEDDTPEVAARAAELHGSRGVRYHRVECRSVHEARGIGMEQTQADVLCFLDADNVMPPRYLAAGLAEFTSENVGVVYCDLDRFGERVERTNYPVPRDSREARDMLSRTNFADACALVRRQALLTSGAWDRPIHPALTMDDWHLWRSVARWGWEFRKQRERLRYRVHSRQRSRTVLRGMEAGAYYWNRGLDLETITLFIPLSGRAGIWRDHLAPWLGRQTWPRGQTRLVLADSSQSPEFSAAVRAWAAGCGYPDVRHLQFAAEEPGASDEDRRLPGVEWRVQMACCRVYNRLRSLLETDFAWIVEDDIVPPDDAAERLLRTFAPDVASCSGPYLSRYDPDFVVHGFDGKRLPRPETPCVQPILSSGFGCLMARSELLRKHVFQVPPGRKWYDPSFFESIDRRRWRCMVDWSCECGHVGERRTSHLPN